MHDYIIVGFGICGLSVHKQLKERGYTYQVISDQSQNATLAAGGLVNPVMLKTGKLVWEVDTFLPYARQFYDSFSEKVFHPYPIHRVFNSILEQNQHLSQANSTNQNYVSGQLQKPYIYCNAPNKMSVVKGGGVLDIQGLIAKEKQQLIQNQQWNNASFDFAKIELFENYITYGGIKARNIVFTEGFGIQKNPFFKHLPIEGNKGEYIIIKSELLQLEAVLKNKYFLIPLQNNLYKYGATYSRGKVDNTPTVSSRNELEKHLNELITCPYEIVSQVAGIRPTVKDKKPIYGSHENQKCIHILNGMGSRGLLMAPLLAKELIDYVEHKTPLRRAIDIRRFL